MARVKQFEHVAVLKGGPSSEREVSLRSGAAVAKGLRQAGYTVTEIDVTGRVIEIPAGIEAVFVALHGEFGEDGTVQAILRDRGIPYTGSNPESSRRAFDKQLSLRAFKAAGVPTPPGEILAAGQARSRPLPVVVKPLRQGSSYGVHRVFAEAEWAPALADALRYDGEVLVEQYIEGLELTVGIVGDQVLPVVEIRAPQGFYDYDAKYTYAQGQTEYLVPAPLASDRAAECRRLAGLAFQALGCAGMGRVDFRMNAAGELFALELNNIPGFTETSLLPKAARAAGIEFSELCDRIMRLARVH